MTEEKKQAYENKIQAQLDEWQAEINKLKAQAQEKGADAQIAYNEQLAKLEEKKDNAAAKLDAVKSASDNAWQDLKGGVQQATQDLSDVLDSARRQF